MKTLYSRFFCLLLVIGILLSLCAFGADDKNETYNSISFYEYKNQNKENTRPDDVITVKGNSYKNTNDKNIKVIDQLDGVKNVLITGSEGYVEWEFNVLEEGLYNIAINYYPIQGKGNSIERIVYINGEVPYNDLYSVSLPRFYTNKSLKKTYDENGNELRQIQTEKPQFKLETLTASNYNVSEPLAVKLKKGKNTIKLEAVQEPVGIDYIQFFQKKDEMSYSQISKDYKSGDKVKTIHIEGESATLKNDKTLYAVSDRSSPLNSPNSISKIVMNMIGGSNWKSPKQSIQWDFTASETGLYKIVIRGKQDFKPGEVSCRRLLIDGKVPFSEANNVEFPYALDFHNYTIGEGNNAYLFYIEAGKHTLTLENNVGKIGTVLERLNLMVSRLNAVYKKVFMITGSYPDADRDYNIELALPDTKNEIIDIEKNLEAIKNDYFKLSGSKGTGYSDMEKLQLQLKSFEKDMETIPVRLDTFRINISNLSAWLLDAVEQPLLIDYIDLLPADAKVSKAESGFFGKIAYEIKSFFVSFFVDYNSINVSKTNNDNTVTMWLGTGRDQAQAIKEIINNDFTPNKKIGVNIRLVDLGVLLPAVAAGKGPDVAISLDRSLPLNYAYRGAVQELSGFNGFNDVIKRFNPESLTEFRYRDKYYALPDKYTFYMMFYRKDILNEMNIKIPKTWDEVFEIIPKLQNNHMGIGLPNIGDNNIDMFTTLLYQENGNIYDKALTKTELDTEEALKAFKKFTDFYTKYKVNQKIDHLSYFRTGQTPIIFMPYTFYANLQAAAPEIKGLWDFAPIPGTVQSDKTINRIVSGTSTGCVIFSNSKHKQAAWEFLKWWTDKPAQLNFGTEIESIQGPSGRYATANIEALKLLPWSNTELKSIIDQSQYTKAMPEAPGGYMTSRYIISATMVVINNGLLPRDTLMDYNKMINDEVTSMRKKFGLS